MRVAIIGSGISGISAADCLSEKHEVTLFEANQAIGGHADTQQVEIDGELISVDTGFIVFNPDNYPTFMELLTKYGVKFKDSDMSFAVSDRITGLEYNAASLNQLFCQRKNIISPKFYRMIYDIFRFYKEAKSLLNSSATISLGDYLQQHNYSDIFIQQHIIPMTCALWSGDTKTIFNFPAKFLVAFMSNHKMMQAFNRPIWKTISGGSRNYLNAIENQCQFAIKTNTPVLSVERYDDNVTLNFNDGSEAFDKVVFACHSDQALRLLESPTKEERLVLGDIEYQANTICLHRDMSVLPANKNAWASWSVLIDDNSAKQCTVSYYMNLLQSLQTNTPVIVSLNMQHLINPDLIWKTVEYHHPVYNEKTINAQNNRHLLQGKMNTYFSGAYWGWGFHEDGARSGKEAAQQLIEDLVNA